MRWSVRDVPLWGFFALTVLLERAAQGGVGAPWPVVAVGLIALGVIVAVRRSHPLAALYGAAALPLLQWAYVAVRPGPFSLAYVVALPVMSHLAGRRLPRDRPVLLSFVAVALLELVLAVAVGTVEGSATRWAVTWFDLTLALVFLIMCPWLIGRYRRLQQELVRAGWERAERLEREQRITADRERLRERARIAQEMHDSLGHELSLIALRAGALEMASDLEERHRVAAGELRAGAASATERLREIIGVLREPHRTSEDPVVPLTPARESVTALVERARASGMPVELLDERTDGGSGPLPDMAGHAVHRIVRESLTNAAKHAPGAVVTVRLARSEDETVVTVTNGPPRGGSPRAPGSGLGLVGLRERVRLAGGTLRAGHRDDGFEVLARLPHTAPAESPGDDAADRSGSAHGLARARGQARRGLVTALMVPLSTAASLAVALLAYYLYTTENSVLDPARFGRLRVGEQRSSITLPPVEMIDAPVDSGPAPPPGASCRYYRSDDNPLGVGDVYRLCFADGRLVAKDVLSAADRQRRDDR
ncbi:histidine kinase [Actinoallomurus purpureus]|uniref:sensor histidine kinase n=1 Tax=Actinoallomurus purpureus TaxID=478114 RepID=UPI0020934DE3|nr:histidine kinase [Actinoallomurus purpureus]MCO6006528.1 histidine kinase [Actinoallomurus purpureus]